MPIKGREKHKNESNASKSNANNLAKADRTKRSSQPMMTSVSFIFIWTYIQSPNMHKRAYRSFNYARKTIRRTWKTLQLAFAKVGPRDLAPLVALLAKTLAGKTPGWPGCFLIAVAGLIEVMTRR